MERGRTRKIRAFFGRVLKPSALIPDAEVAFAAEEGDPRARNAGRYRESSTNFLSALNCFETV